LGGRRFLGSTGHAARGLLYLAMALGARSAFADEPPAATVTHATAPIRVDGMLDEADWQRAGALDPLIQREPTEGGPPSQPTEVRILYDADTLYFGIVCHELDPGAIVATQLGRDADLSVDDYVLVVFDPFLDHRNGFLFQVNAAGARADAQISNNVEHLTYEWDGIWNARTRITATGWTAEIAVPFKTLRFRPGQPIWGLNVERQIKRLQEKDRWAAARRDIWITNLAAAGRLAGLEGAQQGRGLDIRPYLAGGAENGASELKAGLDVFKNLAPNLTAAVSVNTDFAETEADQRQVNLTRFPLFFPEKRAFFLEGAGVYDTAGKSEDLIPFFTRRIGLIAGQEVPLLGGLKVTGRVSDWNLGVLDVQTRPATADALGRIEGQNLGAVRVSRNLFEQSWVGGIFTRGDPTGAGNSLAGADVRLATSRLRGGKNLSLDLYAYRTDGPSRKTDYAYGFKLDYPNDLWDVALSGKHIGVDFQPALGFVPRVGIRKVDLGISLQPRPGRFGIRQFFFELRPTIVTNLGHRVENWRVFTAPFNCRTESGEHLELNYIPEFEHLDAPFEIQPGIVIPSGSHQWTRFRAEVNTATKRPWVVDFALWWGGFYEGTLRQIEPGVTIKAGRHFSAAVLMERNDASLPQGRFATQLFSGRLEYNRSADLSWSNLVQYDSVSRILGGQSRLRWTLKPGNDLYLVVSRGWFRRFDGRYLPEFDRASAKLQYTFRL
jgi:hypothetical protein